MFHVFLNRIKGMKIRYSNYVHEHEHTIHTDTAQQTFPYLNIQFYVNYFHKFLAKSVFRKTQKLTIKHL